MSGARLSFLDTAGGSAAVYVNNKTKEINMKTFDIIMAIAWVGIAIAYGVIAIKGIQISAWEVCGPCLLCAMPHFEKLFDKGDK